MKFSEGIQAIALPDEEDVPDPGTIATVTGWGATSVSQKYDNSWVSFGASFLNNPENIWR